MRTMLAVLAGIAIAGAVVACGGPMASKSAAPPTSVDSGAGSMPGESPRAEIERLSADIAASLDQAAVPAPEPWSASSMDVDPRPMTAIEAVCEPPAQPGPGCGDICKLGTHICDNAERICTLADELAPDEWSKGKCEDGKKSCEASRKKCCECV